MTLFDQPTDAPTRRIVEHLQRHGPATIRDLEALLGVTTTAVRAHLAGLLGDGYVERRAVHQGVGRPYHAYALTPRARELYACHCDDLALTLLQEVFAIEGKERAGYLLDRVGAKLAQRYAGAVRAEGLRDRVEQMAQVLQQRGVLTDVEVAPPAATDGSFSALAHEAAGGEVLLLKAYNCPFHELAQEHREICEMDERMLQSVLGADVQLSGCMMSGASRCTFVVRPSTPAQNGEAAGRRLGERASAVSGLAGNGTAPTVAAPSLAPAGGAPAARAATIGVALAMPERPAKEGKEGKGGKKKKHKKGR
jgi:predicted ArsR family transcriptional regulator